MRSTSRVVLSSLCLTLIAICLRAQDGAVEVLANPDEGEVASYWTPERLREAQPLPPAPVDRDAFFAAAEQHEAAVPAARQDARAEGRGPIAGIRPDLHNRLFEVDETKSSARSDKAAGSTGAYFTSARLVPQSADTTYPYSTVGKLFFTIPGVGNRFCSGAVLRQRVVVTAAQCLHSGTSNPGFFTNFLFVPAHRNGVAPFGSWTWNYVIVNTTWSQGGGTLPNAADYGMIEMNDRTINGVLRRIGEVTGILGYQTLKLTPNHAHILAYASNFDAGEKMHQVTSQSFRKVANNVEYGSDMRGGSAGGPLIQDFGDNAALVRLIGVLSYFSSSTNVRTEGASIPDGRFTGLLNSVCGHRAGNC
jgi:V8-like Glu-specific endopeptidase